MQNFKQIPCAGHRLNLCVNDLFNEKKTKSKIERNIDVFRVKDFNEEGN